MANKICFLGFGEASYHIAKDLVKNRSLEIVAFDVNWNTNAVGERIQKRATDAGITLRNTAEEACEDANFIFCLTSASSALEIASNILPKLQSGQCYVDMNSASPKVMTDISSLKRPGGVLFCDAAIMDTVPGKGFKVPIFASGDGAANFGAAANIWGMQVTVLEAAVGGSSAIKMFRSVFMKGIPQLMFESFLPAVDFGVLDVLIDSINSAIYQKSITDLAETFIVRTMIHAKRRASEMKDVVQTLNDIGFDASMAIATEKKLEMLAQQNWVETIAKTPNINFKEALELLSANKMKLQEN